MQTSAESRTRPVEGKWMRHEVLDTPERVDYQYYEELQIRNPALLPEEEFELYFGKTLEVTDTDDGTVDKDSLIVDLFDEAKYRVHFGYFKLSLIDPSRIARFEESHHPSIGRVPLSSYYNPQSHVSTSSKTKHKMPSGTDQNRGEGIIEYYPWSRNFSLEMQRKGLRPNESYHRLLAHEPDVSRQDSSQVMSFAGTEAKVSARRSIKDLLDKPFVCSLYTQPHLTTQAHRAPRPGIPESNRQGSVSQQEEFSSGVSHHPFGHQEHFSRENYHLKQDKRSQQFTGILSSADRLKVR